jgi:hypothetical protein
MPMLANAMTAKRAADGGGQSGEQAESAGVECVSLATDGGGDKKEDNG